MNFPETYKKLKPAIVAIVSKISSRPDMPDILGTGFIAREDGLIVTNNHVVEVIKRLPRRKGAPDTEWPIQVMYLQNIPEKGMASAFFEVEGVGTLSREVPVEGVHYGADVPDIGFIFVKIKGLPTLEIEDTFKLQEGDEVFISGFPMGTRTLRAPGWIHQVNPVLQRGVVGAIQPFPCSHPHGLLIDAMVQGGSSGSPILNPETGKVEALLYGGLIEQGSIRVAPNIALPYSYGTSLTLSIPAYIINDLLKKELYNRNTGLIDKRDTNTYQTLEEMFATKEVKVREPKKDMPDIEAVSPDDLIFPPQT